MGIKQLVALKATFTRMESADAALKALESLRGIDGVLLPTPGSVEALPDWKPIIAAPKLAVVDDGQIGGMLLASMAKNQSLGVEEMAKCWCVLECSTAYSPQLYSPYSPQHPTPPFLSSCAAWSAT
jgi:hypothetical protein